MRLRYLKEHQKVIYTIMLIDGTLFKHLQIIDKEANQLYNRLIDQYKIKWNITEELKENDQMKWIQEMNNLEDCVKEIVLNDVICQR